MMKKIVLYGHSGSENHGCEAIVRSTKKILDSKIGELCIIVSTIQKNEDIKYGLPITEFIQNNYQFSPNLFLRLINKILCCCFKVKNLLPSIYYKEIVKNIRFDKECEFYFSVGGDNYCCEAPEWLYHINLNIDKHEKYRILWGCSIEPDTIDERMVEDLKKYELIIARESITYNALASKRIVDYIHLYPDPAFTLDAVYLKLPSTFSKGNTIGLNLSPQIIRSEKINGITIKNYVKLIEHILETTKMSIALIPHVIWESNDDRKVMHELFLRFKNSGRIFEIGDHNCMELKGFISRCCMFIGARTHATIAAYSTCVPTIAVGYSVKAKGIAKDIFGTYENYVLPVQSLQDKTQLIAAFEWLKTNQDNVREHLQTVMPSYIEKAWLAGEVVKKYFNDIRGRTC